MKVAGAEITDQSQVAGLVEKQLTGTGPWSSPADQTPVDGLQRAAHAAGALAPAFAKAMTELMQHHDAAVRAGAIAAIWAVGDHVDPDRLAELLEERKELFEGVPKPDRYPFDADDLAGGMVIAIAKSAKAGKARSNALLMKELEKSGSLIVLLALARTMPDWLAANAARLVPRRAIGGTLRALPTRRQRERLVRELSPWPSGEGAKLIAKPAWTLLKLPADEKAELEALILGKRPPSMKTVRSSDEAHAYMDLSPCPGCGAVDFERQSRVESDDAGMVTVYEGPCSSCGKTRRFDFGLSADLPPASTDDAVVYGAGRSELMDAGDFLAAADFYARRNGGVDDMRRAIGALDEVLAAIPEGQDRAPDAAFFTASGRRVREREPGRFSRLRLQAVRDTYLDVLNRLRD